MKIDVNKPDANSRATENKEKSNVVDSHEFMKELVHRLQSELKKYQESNPSSIKESNINNVQKFTDSIQRDVSECLKPLIQAYDERIVALEKNNIRLTNENYSYKSQLRSAELETNRLREASNKPAPREVQRIAELQERIFVLSKENDKLMNEKKSLLDEIGQLRLDVKDRESKVDNIVAEISEANQKVHQAELEIEAVFQWKSKAEETITAKSKNCAILSEENEQLREEISSIRAQLTTEKAKLTESKLLIEEITSAYKNSTQDIKAVSVRENSLKDDIKALQLQCDETASELFDSKRELSIALQKCEDLSQTLFEMQSQLKQKDDEDLKNFQELETTRQRLAEYDLEKHTFSLEIEAEKKENARLRERLNQTLSRHEAQLKSERENLASQFGLERRKYLEDINSLSAKKAEIEVLKDRAIREKRVIENELINMKQRYPSEIERLENFNIEMQEKVLRSNREREDAMARLVYIQESLSKEQNRYEKELKSMGNDVDNLSRKLAQANFEAEEANQEKLKLFKSSLILQEEVDTLKKSIDNLNRKNSMDQQELKLKYEAEVETYKNQANALLSKYEKQQTEVQDILSNQGKLAAKWKQDSLNTKEKYEKIIGALEEQLKSSTKKIADINEENVKLNSRIDELQDLLTQEKKTHRDLHTLVRDSEEKANSASAQIKILLKREQELIQQIRHLQRSKDQMTAQEKLQHSGIERDPSTLSFHKKIMETKMALRRKDSQSISSELSFAIDKEETEE